MMVLSELWAAVGLRKYGSDGRCIWLKGKEIRDVSGVYTLSELKNTVAIDEAKTIDGDILSDDEVININNWFRPVVKNGKIIIFCTFKK
jgi:hypothetical protein